MVVKVVVAVVPSALHMEDLELTLVNLGEEVVLEVGLKDLEEMVALTLEAVEAVDLTTTCLLYTSPSPRDQRGSRMPSSA